MYINNLFDIACAIGRVADAIVRVAKALERLADKLPDQEVTGDA